MSRLSFCVSVPYALVKVQQTMRTCMPKERIKNPGKIHYNMAWSRHKKRKKIQQWYCPTCHETVCMDACFVIHHS
jgi:hypothetical protein